VTHRMKKTDFGIGARYEIGDMNNARKMLLRPQEPVERRVTHRDRTSDDTVSAHAFTETWLRNDLLFSSGFLFATMDGNFSGSRIYGDDFDVGYVPNALNGTGYIDLDGAMQSREYVLNLNLMATPFTNFTVVPSVRVRREDWEADSSYLQTSGAGAPVPAVAESDGNLLDVQERLDVRYTGFTNWVLFARGEWTQGEGDLDERFATATTVAARLRETEDERFFQKYSVGARWYPARAVTVDFGGYFKKNRYDYDHVFDSTSNAGGNRYPAYLVLQEFETYDAHARLTLRPFSKVTLTSRYEYQVSTIRTEPDAASGLIQAQSSEMTSHIFGQTASWVPWSRLALQAGFNLVVSETDTPTSKFTQAVLDWQNNYWTANLNSTLVLDDKTDLHVGYFYYSSENFQNNSLEGLPLGAEASEHGATAMLSRRLSPRLRWNLRYAFFHSESELYGGKNDYDAHALFSSLQYRF
ncbi:MAG TPA: hypothetical protein PLH97_03635, partial [Verrucomicrobiota bacterium]|nr:hypothetical protein [Verrucomicrobiota bacterium]